MAEQTREPLAVWLETHKDKLVTAAVQQLSERESLRQQAKGPVRWFFDSLIKTIAQNQRERLESLLRNWVAMCSIPIDGEPVGLLPVLSALKRVIWREFQADPPSESTLELAIQLDTVVSDAAEFLSKVEAAALLDQFSHHLTARAQAGTHQEDNAKENFVSVAAHELKTPLTVVEGYTNMLRDLPEAAHPRIMLMVQGIESGTVRLRELVEDLITVSLLEMALLSLEPQPVWLRRILDVAEFEVSKVIGERTLILEIKRETIPSKPIIGDPERLLEMFQKVLTNAVKYTPDGGKIVVSGRALNQFVDITITDSGIGIASENLDRIFEKFSAIGDLTRHSSGKVKFKGGGAGLGLVIAKGIAEAHGGTVWAESQGYDEENRPGSRFHIMLPLRDVTTGEGMAPLVASAVGTLVDSLAVDRGVLAGNDGMDGLGQVGKKAEPEPVAQIAPSPQPAAVDKPEEQKNATVADADVEKEPEQDASVKTEQQ